MDLRFGARFRVVMSGSGNVDLQCSNRCRMGYLSLGIVMDEVMLGLYVMVRGTFSITLFLLLCFRRSLRLCLSGSATNTAIS